MNAHLYVSKYLQTGIMGRFPFGTFVFKRLDEQLKETPEYKEAIAKNPNVDPTGQRPDQPHVEYFSTELYGGGPQHIHLPTKPEHSVFANLTMLFGSQSKGTVRLRSADPFDKPVIDHKYLEHPMDLAILAQGCKWAHEVVMQGKGTKQHITGAWPTGRKFPETDEEWKQYVREQVGTTYHPGKTVKMGPDSDPEACVDPRLRVRGVKNLRVADVSILPKLNNGHTQAPAYMVGEKVAIMLLEDNRA
ncbi:hypothetical protein DL93DRAFT_2076961 [Clavulina sp. PMI_390]|nr:hypothetical protein DL93DRAFT_2076961 [Clavulina sp. PMI_390]